MRLLDFINEKTNDAYKDYKLVSVIFDKKNKECTFKFLYKNETGDDAKRLLTELIKEFLHEDSIAVVVKCKKAYADKELVRDVLYNFLMRNYASVCVDFDKNNIKTEVTEDINVQIFCNKFQHGYLSSNDIKKEIMDYAEGFFFEPFYLDIIFDEEIKDVEEENIPANIFFDDSNADIKTTKINNIKPYIGEINGYPIAISSIKGAMENIEIAGAIKFCTQKSFMSKRKDKDGNNIEKIYFSFTLVDKTGRMNAVYFPLKSDGAKALNLKDDDVIVVHGDVEDFNGRINFKVKSIAYCDIIEEEKVEVAINTIKEPNKDYLFIKPEPYVEMFQDNLYFVTVLLQAL